GIACTTLPVVRGLTPGSCPGLSLCDERGASQSTGGGHTARLGHVTPRHEWPLGVVMVQPAQRHPVGGGCARRYAGPHGVRRRHGGSGVVTLRSRRGAAGGTLAGLRSDPHREGVLARLPRCLLRRTYGQADVPGPLVRQLERLPHIEV